MMLMTTIRTIALIAVASGLVGGCELFGGSPPPPVTSAPRSPAVCEALRPAFPVPELSYDSKLDTRETVADVKAGNRRTRSLNARFAAACP